MKNEQPKDELREHSFDGIQEYNNDLPRWWVRLFYATIFFSVPYLIWYHTPFFKSMSLVEEYEYAKAKEEGTLDQLRANAPDVDYKDAKLVAKGKETYDINCAACHGPQGQGVIGPNLTDDFWIHGHTSAEVAKIIDQGAAAKGMPAWGSMLGQQKVTELVAFIHSIQGIKVENPKAPQGDAGKLE